MSGVSQYSEQIAKKICVELSKGKPLTKICRQEGMPCQSTVYLWLSISTNMIGDKPFSEMYAMAREDQADTLADEILEIADESENDTYEVDLGDGVIIQKENREVVNRSRLRVDARKWVAAKLKPKKYGDYSRNETEITGGERPVKIVAVEGFSGFKKESESSDSN